MFEKAADPVLLSAGFSRFIPRIPSSAKITYIFTVDSSRRIEAAKSAYFYNLSGYRLCCFTSGAGAAAELQSFAGQM